MAPTRLKGYVVTLSSYEHYRPQQCKAWIEKAGGKFEENLTANTTHLAAFKEDWKPQSKTVKTALRKKVEIVKWDWLQEALHGRGAIKKIRPEWDLRKQRESTLKHQPTGVFGQPLGAKRKRADDPPVKLPRKGTVLASFYEDVSKYAPTAKKAKTKVSTGLLAPDESGSAGASIRRIISSASTALNDIRSDAWHIYMDDSGFEYNIDLTKVQIEFNQAQTMSLKIYESNTTPYSYIAVQVHSGYGIFLPKRHDLLPSATNYRTVFRNFRNAFFEHTGIEWDNRFDQPHRPTPRPKVAINDARQKTGFATPAEIYAAGGARHTMPNRPQKIMTDRHAEEFKNAKFKWRNPPVGMPQGIDAPGYQATLAADGSDRQRATANSGKQDGATTDEDVDDAALFHSAPSTPTKEYASPGSSSETEAKGEEDVGLVIKPHLLRTEGRTAAGASKKMAVPYSLMTADETTTDTGIAKVGISDGYAQTVPSTPSAGSTDRAIKNHYNTVRVAAETDEVSDMAGDESQAGEQVDWDGFVDTDEGISLLQSQGAAEQAQLEIGEAEDVPADIKQQ